VDARDGTAQMRPSRANECARRARKLQAQAGRCAQARRYGICTVVVGIAGMEDMKKVGKTGGLALLYFEIVSSVALVVGLIIVNLVQPGVGMNVDASALDTKGIAAYTMENLGAKKSVVGLIIPTGYSSQRSFT
jgi:Na+/H+-dicarboxylate symporter